MGILTSDNSNMIMKKGTEYIDILTNKLLILNGKTVSKKGTEKLKEKILFMMVCIKLVNEMGLD